MGMTEISPHCFNQILIVMRACCFALVRGTVRIVGECRLRSRQFLPSDFGRLFYLPGGWEFVRLRGFAESLALPRYYFVDDHNFSFSFFCFVSGVIRGD